MENSLLVAQIRQRLEILYQMVEELEREPGPGPGPGGTTDYNDLTNKPQIGGTTLSGNKTAADLGLATPTSVATSIINSFSPDSYTLDSGDTFPVSGIELLSSHKPVMINGTQYWFLEETGVDYLYGSTPPSGAFPSISYLRVMKADYEVELYSTSIDQNPTENSDNLVSSGGVYAAIAAAGGGGGGIETITLTKNSQGYRYWPADKMSYFDNTASDFQERVVYINDDGDISLGYIPKQQNNTTYGYYYTILDSVSANSGTPTGVDIRYYPYTIHKSSRIRDFSNNYFIEMNNSNVYAQICGDGSPSGSSAYGDITYKQITKNSNLDSFVNGANYYYCTAANAATLSNCPTTDAFVLQSQRMDNNSNHHLLTIKTCGATPKIYIRNNASGSWTNWFEFSGTEIVPTP